jgi:hypothetical protein
MSCVYRGLPRDLNVSNRRMRTRMSGGVAGDGRATPGRPYADQRWPLPARRLAKASPKRQTCRAGVLKRLAMAGPVVPNEKRCQSPTISCLLETGLDDFE